MERLLFVNRQMQNSRQSVNFKAKDYMESALKRVLGVIQKVSLDNARPWQNWPNVCFTGELHGNYRWVVVVHIPDEILWRLQMQTPFYCLGKWEREGLESYK